MPQGQAPGGGERGVRRGTAVPGPGPSARPQRCPAGAAAATASPRPPLVPWKELRAPPPPHHTCSLRFPSSTPDASVRRSGVATWPGWGGAASLRPYVPVGSPLVSVRILGPSPLSPPLPIPPSRPSSTPRAPRHEPPPHPSYPATVPPLTDASPLPTALYPTLSPLPELTLPSPKVSEASVPPRMPRAPPLSPPTRFLPQ